MIDARLQTLRVLYEKGTVTAAAQALHLTPSTVSQQLRQLSRELDLALLEPQGRRVRLTPAAHALLDHANELYAAWERARADLAAHHEGIAGRLRCCGVSSAIAALAASAAARLRDDWPQITVTVSEEESEDCFSLLLAGDADIAVLIPTPDSPPPSDPRFDQQPLLDEPQDLLVPAAHPLARRHDSAELSEAAGETWIAAPDRLDQYQLLQVACAAAGFTPRITHKAKEWFAISALVAVGLGVCLIPRLVPLPPDHAVIRVSLRGDNIPSRRIITCTRRGSDRQPVIARGLDALRRAATEHGEKDHHDRDQEPPYPAGPENR